VKDPSTWQFDPEASYIHICCNETVHGFEFDEENFPWDRVPKDMVVVGDMSSNIGTRPINWDHFDVVYAGAQKNMGPSGCTIIIVKESLLGHKDKDVPIMGDWEAFENAAGSYYNTPPCWAIYVTGLNVSYMNQTGGLKLYEGLAK
jgi:phosphoserine aminotransferase